MRLNKGLKASIGLMISSFIVKAINYCMTPVYTRILPTEVYGEVSVFMTIKTLMGYPAMFCLSYAIFNNAMLDYSNDRDNLTYAFLKLSNIITIIVCLIFAFVNYATGDSIISRELLLLLVAIYLLEPAYNFWISRQRYEYKYKYPAIVSVGTAIISALCSILFVFLCNNKKNGRIFGAEVPCLIVYLVIYIYILVRKTGKINKEYWKYALKYNWPLLPYYLSIYALSSSDKLIINHLCGSVDTAYYTLAYSFVAIGLIVWNAITASLVPFTYENIKAGKVDRVKSINKFTIYIMLFVVVLVILIAPEAILIAGSDKFTSSINVLPPVIAGLMFQVIYGIVSNIINYHKKTKVAMMASITAAVANIALNYIFIPIFGYVAAAYTTMACYALQALIMYIIVYKEHKNEMMSMPFLAIISIITVALAMTIPILYAYPLLRWFVIAAFLSITGFLALKNGSELKKMILH